MYYQEVVVSLYGRELDIDRIRRETQVEWSDESNWCDVRAMDLKAPTRVPNRETILWVTDCVSKVIQSSGIEKIVLDIAYYHDGQCNVELSLKELEAIVSIGAKFTFSVYENEELVESYLRDELP